MTIRRHAPVHRKGLHLDPDLHRALVHLCARYGVSGSAKRLGSSATMIDVLVSGGTATPLAVERIANAIRKAIAAEEAA